MPVHLVEYTSESDSHSIKHEIVWISPTGWTLDQVIEGFRRSHPRAAIRSFADALFDEDLVESTDRKGPCNT